MKRFRLKWIAGLMLGAMLAAGATHFLHRFQMKRIATAFLREGQRAQTENRFADAIRYLRSYVSLVPNDIDGLAEFGELLAKVGRVEPAYLTLEKVLRRDPGRTKTKRTLVTLAMQMGRFKEARINLEDLLRQLPGDGELWELKGRCQIAQGEFEQARETLQAAVKKVPSRLECYGLLAALEFDKFKNPGAALEHVNLMVEKNRTNPLAFLHHGQWLLQLMNSPDASRSSTAEPRSATLAALATDAARATELAPTSAETLAFATRAALLNKAVDRARECVQRGLAAHPHDARFYLLLSELEGTCARPEAALDALKRGTVAIPDNRDLRWNFANRLVDLGRKDEVASAIAQLQAEGHPSELTGFLEARQMIHDGKWLQAIARLESIRPQLREWPELAKQGDLLLARAYRETDAGDKQLACLRRAVDLDPNGLAPRLALADALLSANSVREANEEYRRVLRSPDVPPSASIEFAKSLYRIIVRRTPAEQDWSEFDAVLGQIEKQTPDSVPLAILRAEKLVAQNLNADATDLISKIRQRLPGEIDLWTVQITLAQLDQKWDQVKDLLQEAEKQFPQNATLRIVRGRYLIQQSAANAAEQLRILSQPSSEWPAAETFVFLRNFSLMFMAIGENKDAARTAEMAARSQKDDLSIRLILFDIALRAGDLPLMTRVLADVRGITGEGPLWHYGEAAAIALLADSKDHSQRLGQALSHLAAAKAQRPTWARIPMLLAEIDKQKRDAHAETEHLLESIQLGERSSPILSRAVALLFEQQRYVEADQVVRRLQERQNLFTGEMIRSASEISLRLNDTSRALDLAEQLARNSDKTADKVWLAQVLGVLGRHQEAEQKLRSVIEAERTAPVPWIALVQVLVRAGERVRAEAVIVEAQSAIAPGQAPLAIAQGYEILGKNDLARSNYQLALQKAPGDLLVSKRAIEFQMRTGLTAEAEPLLRKLLADATVSDGDRQWATRNLALARASAGRDGAKEALELIEGNLSVESPAPLDQRVKALILARQPLVESRRKAVKIFEKLLTQETDTSVEDRFLLAKLYLATGERSKGRAELRRVLAARANEPRYLAAFLQLLLQALETSEAELWLTRLQAIAPDDLATADFQAQLLFAKNRHAEVLTFVREVTARPPAKTESPEAAIARKLWGARRIDEYAAKLREQKLDREAADFETASEQMYQQYVQQRPADVLLLAEHSAGANQIDRSLELLEQHLTGAQPERVGAVCVAIMKNPQATDPQMARLQQLLQSTNQGQEPNLLLSLVQADLLSWRGEFDAAILKYREVLRHDSKNIAAINNLAVMLAISGRDGEEALRLIQSAISLAGPSGVLLDSRGLVHLRNRNIAEALADFEASHLEAENSEIHFHIALALGQLNRLEAAKRSLAKADELGLRKSQLHPSERVMLAKLQASVKN